MDEEKEANPSGINDQDYDQAKRDYVDDANQKSQARLDTRLAERAASIKNAISNNPGKAKLAAGTSGILALIIFGFIALLPLKLEAIMKNIFEKRVGDKIEHLEEKRADKIIIRYLTQSGSDQAVYSNGQVLTSLYRNWKRTKFETKFTQKSGIKIEPHPDGSGVRITAPDGKLVGNYNESELSKFLDGGATKDLKGIDARRFIREVTRDQTKWFQIYKRVSMRKFMRNAYGIRKWSWFTGKEGAAADAEVSSELIENGMAGYSTGIGDAIDCALDSQKCHTDEGTPRDAPLGNDEIAGAGAEPKPGESALAEGATEATTEAIKETEKQASKKLVDRALTKVLEPIIGKVITEKIVSKAIPFVGQVLLVDMLARIDDFFHSGNADKTIRTMHKAQYVAQFIGVQSMQDNSKDPTKRMSGDEYATLMNRVGDPSQSAGFQQIFLGKEGGTGIGKNLGVGDIKDSFPIRDDYNLATIANPQVQQLRALYAVEKASHLDKVVNWANEIIGGVIGLALDGIKAALNLIPGIDSLKSQFGGYIDDAGKWIGKVFISILPPAVDGTEKDASFFTSVDVGASVFGEDYCKHLGCHRMTTAQTSELNSAIAFEKNADQKPSLYDRFFSPDLSGSMVNKLAAITPTTPGQAASQISNYSVATIKNPLNIFDNFLGMLTGKATAASEKNLYGLQDYGFTETELSQPIQLPDKDYNNDGKIDQADCQYNPDGSKISDSDFNNLDTGRLCLLDMQTVQDLGAMSSTAAPE